MSLRKKMILIVLMCFFIFGYVVFSDTVNTRYTKFYFLSGGISYKNITVDLDGGVTGNVDFYLENKSDTAFPVNMSFVDSNIVTFESKSVRICKSEKETSDFGQYVSVSGSSFSVDANTGIVKQLDLNFPEHYSGVYLGCVLYSPDTNSGGNWNTFAREAIFLDVDVDFVSAAETSFEVRAYPGGRMNKLKGHEGKIYFYSPSDRTEPLLSGYLSIGSGVGGGTGMYIANVPTGTYDVIYKGKSHLASWLSNVVVVEGSVNELDFTTGLNLSGTVVSDDWGSGVGYQIMGDMLNDIGRVNSQINAGDLSVIFNDPHYGDVGYTATEYDEHDLNSDGKINSIDLDVLIDSWGKEGLLLEMFGGALLW